MKWVTNRLVAGLRWGVSRAPEILLAAFVAALLPLAYFLPREAIRAGRLLFVDPRAFLDSHMADPWPALAWALCLTGTAAFVAVSWRSRFLIWAVARKMIIEALHRKVIIVLLLFFVILMPSLPFILKTEGNPKSQVQIVIGYSLTLAQLLLSLVAVFVCTASVCSEIDRKHVQVTDTKPLRRWQFLVGKLVGVVVMCSALLFLMAGSVYGIVRYMVRERDWKDLPVYKRDREKALRERVSNEVLVSRRAVGLPVPNVREQVKREYERLRTEEQYEDTKRNEWFKWRELTRRFRRHARTVPEQADRTWVIPGLLPGQEQPIYLRFKMTRTKQVATTEMAGLWRVYKPVPREKLPAGAQAPKEGILLGPYHEQLGRWVTDVFQEVPLPGSCVDETGRLYLQYKNLQWDTGVTFDPEEGIEILQRTGGFLPNYYRALLVLVCQISLLAAVALMLGAALSFPVASLTVAAIFIAGLLAPWLSSEALRLMPPEADATFWEAVRGYAYVGVKGVVRGVLAVAPNFARYNPLGDLVNGRMVSWGFIGKAAAVMCFLQGGFALLFGIYIYYRRELARVIVRSL